MDITTPRLHNQHLSHQTLNEPAAIVRYLGAVQAQEYAHAKWAIGMRSLDLTDADIEKAMTDGEIIRTHLMRPTWHFVARNDIRWMLELTGPRVHVANNHYYKQVELDTYTLKRSSDLMASALQGGNYLTRKELLAILEREGIPAGDTIRSSYILMYSELEGVICSGPRRGNQFTYALISERAPGAVSLDHDEALAKLIKRYFSSHGPATIADFVWWSGLTVADTKRGLELNKEHLDSETIDGNLYYFPRNASTELLVDASETAYLLPIYDEYGNAYKRREALFDTSYEVQAKAGNLPKIPFQCQLVIDGKVLGSWKRTHSKNEVLVEAYYYRPLTQVEEEALSKDVARYGRFYGVPVTFQGRAL